MTAKLSLCMLKACLCAKYLKLSAFPCVEYQHCSTHQIHNILKYRVQKDREVFTNELKRIYRVPNEEIAASIRDEVVEKMIDNLVLCEVSLLNGMS